MRFFSAADSGQMGDQVRGFGFIGDGSTDTRLPLPERRAFNPTVQFRLSANRSRYHPRRDVEQYLLAFDSDLAPIVGQQVTLTATNSRRRVRASIC